MYERCTILKAEKTATSDKTTPSSQSELIRRYATPPRKRMQQFEVAEYAKVLAAERRKHADEIAGLWIDISVHLGRMDELAEALGICTNAEDWWDNSTDQKHQKLLGRASVLRGLKRGA